MYKLRFRQVHLDFHTSPDIENIGGAFDKKQWQEALKAGHVNSITCFSKCHHGWSYHDTKVGRRHPHLKIDLLRQQFDAAKEIDVNVPIYLSSGVDNVASYDHPEWREVLSNGQYSGWAKEITQPGFHMMCFNSPYMDYLCQQCEEAARMFPGADGIFLDIISQNQCCCKWCLAIMDELALDAREEADRKKVAAIAMEKYYRRVTAACRCDNPDMPVFHNSGHVQRGNREILQYFSHLELESLPTGGWGYDHFPISAKYCENLPLDILGMTGKFHTTWGEFGGYKHPNALRYECAAMLAFNSKCSIGDQLHPEGKMDESTYALMGAAYSEVEAKEPWCDDVQNVADIGLLSSAAVACEGGRASDDSASDVGAGRILLEGHFLFDVLDTEMDFQKYRLLILPDDIVINADLKKKLDAYLASGGKLMLTGTSGLDENGEFLFNVGATAHGQTELFPNFLLPREDIRPDFVSSPVVIYQPSQKIKVTAGESLGDVYDPYFNRTYKHFSSHQHTPNKPTPSGFSCGVLNKNILYLAHPVFTGYRWMGAVAYKDYIINAINLLLGQPTAKASLPSTARISLMHQPGQNRFVLHLLYANTINRGGEMEMHGGNVDRPARSVEVIEDLLPLRNTKVQLTCCKEVKKVILQPQGQEIDFVSNSDCSVEFTAEEFSCHQMVELQY